MLGMQRHGLAPRDRDQASDGPAAIGDDQLPLFSQDLVDMGQKGTKLADAHLLHGLACL